MKRFLLGMVSFFVLSTYSVAADLTQKSAITFEDLKCFQQQGLNLEQVIEKINMQSEAFATDAEKNDTQTEDSLNVLSRGGQGGGC
jgi:opacity protein-like surface antigen